MFLKQIIDVLYITYIARAVSTLKRFSVALRSSLLQYCMHNNNKVKVRLYLHEWKAV